MIPAQIQRPSTEIFNSMLEDMLLLVARGLDGSIDVFVPTLIVFEQYGAAAPSDPLSQRRAALDAAFDAPPPIRQTVIVMPDFTPDNGDLMLQSLGYSAGLEQRLVTMLFLKHEAWMTAASKSKWREKPIWPTDSPAKQEVVLIKGATIDGRRAMAYAEIKRNAKDGMIAGELVADIYRPEKSANVISRDDFVSAYIRGWQQGFGDAVAALN